MRRTLVFSDVHLNAKTCGRSRYDELDETLRVIARFVKDIAYHDVVFLGDAVDPDAPDAMRCVARMCDFAQQIDRYETDGWYVAGNHDIAEDGYGTTMLSPIGFVGSNAVTIELPEKYVLGTSSCAFLPYPSKCNELNLADWVAANCDPNTRIVFGHLNLPGEGGASESFEMSRGKEHYWPLDAIDQACPDALLIGGHYHVGGQRSYRVPSGRILNVEIVGSPGPFAFGPEEACDPSIISIEHGPNSLPQMLRISLRELGAHPAKMVTVPLNAPVKDWEDARFVRIMAKRAADAAEVGKFVSAMMAKGINTKVEWSDNAPAPPSVDDGMPAFTAQDGIEIAQQLARDVQVADEQLKQEIVALTKLVAERQCST